MSIIVIAGHDLFDRVQIANPICQFLHVKGPVHLPLGIEYYVLFPLVPWCAVMTLGYALGPLLRSQRFLVIIGSGCTLLFVVLRLAKAYGNPEPFHVYGNATKTLIAFLNTEKYPPSLQYLLMTLGPSFIALALLQRYRFWRWMETFGRAPLAFYVAHLYLIHVAALIARHLTGRTNWPLAAIWLFWLLIVATLYPFCRWWSARLPRR